MERVLTVGDSVSVAEMAFRIQYPDQKATRTASSKMWNAHAARVVYTGVCHHTERGCSQSEDSPPDLPEKRALTNTGTPEKND